MRAIQEWYLDWLFHRLSVVNARIRRVQCAIDGTASNQYTDGYLGYLDRKMDRLAAKQKRIDARIARIKD